MNDDLRGQCERVQQEMLSRSARRQPFEIELLVAEYPAVINSNEHLLDLICCESELKRQRGEPVTLQDYARRFRNADLSKLPERLAARSVVYVTPSRSSSGTPGGMADTEHQSVATPLPASLSASTVVTLPAGTPCGEYKLVRKIGRGGHGDVYLAHHVSNEQPVAIKLLRKRKLELPPDFEAGMQSRLNHPHIVRILHSGETDAGEPYLVMQYIDGEPLDEYLKRLPRPVSLRQKIEWVAQLADALNHAHQNNVVHRDVKPANIMIDRRGAAYLADFSVALDPDRLQSKEGIGGTVQYMSPEQAQRFDPLDGRSDVFSLGVVLYELLVGRNPFPTDAETESRRRKEIKRKLDICEPRPPRQIQPKIAADVEAVCLRALRKQPGDRFRTAGDMRDALRACLRRRSIAFGVRALLGSAAAVLLLVLCYGVYSSWAGAGAIAGSPDNATDPTLPTSPPAPIAAQQAEPLLARADLEFEVTRPTRDGDKVLPIEEKNFRPADRFTFNLVANVPANWYLLWYDEEGRLTVLRPEKADAVRQAVLARQIDQTRPGLNLVIAAAATRPLTADELAELQAIIIHPQRHGNGEQWQAEFHSPEVKEKSVDRGSVTIRYVPADEYLGPAAALLKQRFAAYHGRTMNVMVPSREE